MLIENDVGTVPRFLVERVAWVVGPTLPLVVRAVVVVNEGSVVEGRDSERPGRRTTSDGGYSVGEEDEPVGQRCCRVSIAFLERAEECFFPVRATGGIQCVDRSLQEVDLGVVRHVDVPVPAAVGARARWADGLSNGGELNDLELCRGAAECFDEGFHAGLDDGADGTADRAGVVDDQCDRSPTARLRTHEGRHREVICFDLFGGTTTSGEADAVQTATGTHVLAAAVDRDDDAASVVIEIESGRIRRNGDVHHPHRTVDVRVECRRVRRRFEIMQDHRDGAGLAPDALDAAKHPLAIDFDVLVLHASDHAVGVPGELHRVGAREVDRATQATGLSGGVEVDRRRASASNIEVVHIGRRQVGREPGVDSSLTACDIGATFGAGRAAEGHRDRCCQHGGEHTHERHGDQKFGEGEAAI